MGRGEKNLKCLHSDHDPSVQPLLKGVCEKEQPHWKVTGHVIAQCPSRFQFDKETVPLGEHCRAHAR